MPVPRLLPAAILALLLATATLTLSAGAVDEASSEDEKLLRDNRVDTDGPGLLAFLRLRSLSDTDRVQVETVVRQLGSDSFAVREQASAALVARGPAVVPILRAALRNPDAEIARRARRCLSDIEQGPGATVPAAAVRLLAQRKPAGAVEGLLRFVPFADDEWVEEEVHKALVTVGLGGGKAHPALVAALADPAPARRRAAAFVAPRGGDEERAAAARLLQDADLSVRLCAAYGLIAAGDRRGVPVLIQLLSEAPAEPSGRAEELLLRLVGDQAPVMTVGPGPAERKKWQAAWESWWKEKGPGVDLRRIDRRPEYLGLTLVPEMHGNKVWECGPDGKVRWVLEGLRQPRDAQVLPGGRVLVCEVQANLVTERDRRGNVVWSHPVTDPAYVQRLSNGNTFIGTHHRAVEVTPRGKEVFVYAAEPEFFIHSMHRKPNSHVVCLSMQGKLREVDRAGKVVFEVQLDVNNRNWCGVEGLPGNRYLCVDLNQGQVLEVDQAGKTLWSCQVGGASYAVRRPNGRTLVCSFNDRRVVEVDRAGKIVWQKDVPTSPWRVHSR
jgi:HEAT repeat protein